MGTLTTAELEAKLCYAAIIAGKSARFAETVTQRLWAMMKRRESPFKFFRRCGSETAIWGILRQAGTGNYNKLAKCFWELAKDTTLDLRTCDPADLEFFHGIGPKTSRFFIIWTRPEASYAALDVHILRWMGQQGYAVPRSTPSNKKLYRRLESAFIAEAAKRGMTPRQLDWHIWRASNKSGIVD